MRALALLAALALPAAALAQERPSDDELFGKPAEEPAGPRDAPPATPGDREAHEAELFGSDASPASQPPPEGLVPKDPDDPLRIGGQLYLRLQTQGYDGEPFGDSPLVSPNLLDLYLDARPNDRVRAFVLARTSYDPTGGSTLPASLAGALGLTATTKPQGVLDQLWINFDMGRTVFVTAGRQHVKWGVGKFWNPTDYLHPVKRDPLAVFDARAGVTMVRAHLPWEKYGWNLYGVALLEDASGARETVNRLGRVGAGARAELVLGAAELGLDALVQDGSRPRFGVDLSAGVWELDLYGELAVRTETDAARYREVNPAAPYFVGRYGEVRGSGFEPQVVLGGSWTRQYGSDQDTFTVGAEWFWNGFGYDDRAVYAYLLSQSAYPAFYVGQQYLGAYVSLPSPGSWNDTSFTLSALGNLSDRSFTVRLDHSVLALTYLRVETYVAAAGGTKGGEFRLAIDPQTMGGAVVFPGLPAPTFSAGVALRVSL